MTLRQKLCRTLLGLMMPCAALAQSDNLLTRVWSGEQQAQDKFTNACGTMTETRTSKLLTKPMVLHGRFCAEGTTRFMLEYSDPNPMQLRVNGSVMNLTVGGKTQARDISDDIARVQRTFSSKNSLAELQKDFEVTASETSTLYELRLIPRVQSYRRKLNYLTVKLSKRDFLPRVLEVDGKSGVNSLYIFDVTSSNTRLAADTFAVSAAK